MELLTGFLYCTVAFLLVLTVLVFVHELGHYAVARFNGVRVEVFSIGFGPELFGWTDKAETRWKFSAIPLGGYVKMFGENEFGGDGEALAQMTPEQRKVSFHSKRLGQRAAIVFAGPAANYLFAVAVLAGLFSIIGQPFTPAEIGTVKEDSAAAEAGMQPGDVFLRIDGRDIERFEDVQQIVRFNPEKALEIVVRRGEEEVTLTAVPRKTEVTDRSGNVHKIGLLGVTRQGVAHVKRDPATAVWQAAKETYNLTALTLSAIGDYFAGTRDTSELGGPVRIAKWSCDFAELGIVPLISFMALLSINLGLINLFPVPVLDGGHLLFYAFELVLGRPLGEKAQEFGIRIGLVLVLGLMVFVTINDLVNLRIFDFVKSLVT
jgi:regulator of sigma E protease